MYTIMVYKIVGDTGYLFICISKVCSNKACSNTANSPTVTQQPADELLLLLLLLLLLKCCFTSTETVGLLGTEAQDVHLNFHTAPELCGLLLLLIAFNVLHSSLLSGRLTVLMACNSK